MICKNCGSEVNENELFCKVCGASVGKEKKTFNLEIPKELLGDAADNNNGDVTGEKNIAQIGAASDEALILKETKEIISDKENIADSGKNTLPQEPNEEKQDLAKNQSARISAIKEQAAEETAAIEPTAYKAGKTGADMEMRRNIASAKAAERQAAAKGRQSAKKAKKANKTMRILTCLCAAAVVALTALSVFTGIFEKSGNEKTVVLSSLSESDKASFEEEIVKYVSLFENGYDSETSVADDILDYVDPSDKNGLYQSVVGKAELETQTADPAKRFVDNEGNVQYYTAKYTNIKKVFKALNISPVYDANCGNYYYYQGNYYFSADTGVNTEAAAVNVTDSKKTSDGNYYVVCDVYHNTEKNEDGTYKDEPIYQRYVLATLEKSGDKNTWTVLKISAEPLYNEYGSKVQAKEDELSFVIKSKTITAKTSDGKVFAKYIVQYPYFETDGATQLAVNTMYSKLISTYKGWAKKADSRYQKYIDSGGDPDALPKYVHVISSVKYNEGGYFSLIERKTTYDPAPKQDGEENSLFAQSEYTSYTFDITGGDFVRKDEVLGKDYLAAEESLYKIWLGAVDSDENENIPADTQNIGQAIYSSAWVLTKNGICFYYQGKDGALEKVTAPYSKFPDRTIM